MPLPPRVLVLNGPNLNLLGLREPPLYGSDTLADVEALCRESAARHCLEVDFRQSNTRARSSTRCTPRVPGRPGSCAGGYTHTSIALRDALATVDGPVVEVCLTHIHQREEYRHRSYVAEVADAMIAGAGIHGYALALTHLAHLLEKSAA